MLSFYKSLSILMPILEINSYICAGNIAAQLNKLKIMIKQKLISFKVDIDQLALLDSILPMIGWNRNKFLNYALNHALDVLSYQIPVAQKYGWDCSKVNFLTCDN